MRFVDLKTHQIHFLAGAPPRTPLEKFMMLPRPPSRIIRMGRAMPPLHPISLLDAFGVSVWASTRRSRLEKCPEFPSYM